MFDEREFHRSTEVLDAAAIEDNRQMASPRESGPSVNRFIVTNAGSAHYTRVNEVNGRSEFCAV
jgi:hypothetical protein